MRETMLFMTLTMSACSAGVVHNAPDASPLESLSTMEAGIDAAADALTDADALTPDAPPDAPDADANAGPDADTRRDAGVDASPIDASPPSCRKDGRPNWDYLCGLYNAGYPTSFVCDDGATAPITCQKYAGPGGAESRQHCCS